MLAYLLAYVLTTHFTVHIEKMLNVSIASEDDYYTRVLLPWKVYGAFQYFNGFNGCALC